MKKILRDWFTEDDGTSYCIAKALAAIAVIFYLVNVTYSIYIGNAPDLKAFGDGLMQVMIGAGALIAGKQFTQKTSV